MAAMQRLNSIELDPYASAPTAPFGIITADRSGTQEFDDGIAVTPLPAASEMYRVNVFVVDTSHLYLDDEIAKQVISRRETVIAYDEDGVFHRSPMLDPDITRDLHFSSKSGPLGALVISFIVGKWCPPKDIEVSYGQVEVTQNLPYEQFGGRCRDDKKFQHYGRAAAQIVKHFSNEWCDDEKILQQFLQVERHCADLRGLNINKAFMLAANHLPARTLQAESRPGAYRTNYYRSREERKLFKQPLARYELFPGPHERLNLDVYAPISSPLRMASAFMNHGQLFKQWLGQTPDRRDWHLLKETIASLNTDVDTKLTEAVAS